MKTPIKLEVIATEFLFNFFDFASFEKYTIHNILFGFFNVK